MASHQNFPPPVLLEGARSDISIIFPYPPRPEPPIISIYTPASAVARMASISTVDDNGLWGILKTPMNLNFEMEMGKGKQLKDFRARDALAWTWEELWSTGFPMEDEVPPPWETLGTFEDVAHQQEGKTTPMDICSQ